MIKSISAAFVTAALGAAAANEQGHADTALARIDRDAAKNAEIAKAIWSYAETGFHETRSSALLQKQLKDAGFTIRSGVADMPTAFTATWGDSGPVIAMLGEFDALPGVSQAAVPARQPRPDAKAGHACGHHLFGVGSATAAIAVKDWLQRTGTKGTIRFYGTPAEEGGAGKAYMVRDGLFKDVDIALHWHAGDENSAQIESNLAFIAAKFRFRGQSAHAAASPERGRSALDGVEAMNVMANMMREHLPQESRVHYVITRGGEAPNVVPDFAEVFYYVRHPDPAVVRATLDRLTRIAEGAAMGTGTTTDHELISGMMNMLPNRHLQTLVHGKLSQIGGVNYTPEERAFAEQLRTTLPNTSTPLESAAQIKPLAEVTFPASSDVADVSWAVPTAGLLAATWVPGTPAHSWQAVAAGGMSIGFKGMQNAAKVLASTAIELYRKPEHIAAAKAEFEQRRGRDFVYRSLVGDRKPPLDYLTAKDGSE